VQLIFALAATRHADILDILTAEAPTVWKPISELVDHLALGSALIFGQRAFRGSAPDALPAFENLCAEHDAAPPRIRWPERFDRRIGRIRLTMPVIGFDTFADFHPARSDDADTLVIYHHGLREFPHDGSAGGILSRGRLRDRVDWFAIRGAHHDSRASVGERLLFSQESFARGLLSSVYTARALAKALRPRYRHIVLAGMSMGGVIALIEAALGSTFDLTVPLMAGPDVESVVLDSAFSRIVCPRYREGCKAGFLAERLNLTSRLRKPGAPIRAVLSRYDRLFLLEAQQAAYESIPRARFTVISGGHVTAAVRFACLAGLVEDAIDEELWSRPAPAVKAVA
jgi:hypothetical protein